MFHSLLIVAYRIHCYIYIYTYIYLPTKETVASYFLPDCMMRAFESSRNVCLFFHVSPSETRPIEIRDDEKAKKEEKKQPDGIAILKYRCFLFVGVSFVHWQRGAQFLLSQIRFTTYVEMRRIHCEPPISVSCTLLTTDR